MNRVPFLSIIFMGISAFAGFLIPIVLCIYFRKKKRADIPPFFVGCFIFLLFSMILETLIHRVVFSSAVGTGIRNNVILYAIYGGLMAAVFEEFGRLFAFNIILKKYRDKNINALMYGAGHGGFEVAAVLGFTMISNLMLAMMIKSGRIESLLGTLSGGTLTQFQTSISILTLSSPYIFLLGIVERICAVAIQISLSVLVWFSVKSNKSLFVTALLIHFIVAAITVVLAGIHMPAIIIEAALVIIATVLAVFAGKVYRENMLNLM